MTINQLKSFSVRAVGLDDLIGAHSELVAFGKSCEQLSVVVPAWVWDKAREIVTEVNARTVAERRAQLEKLKARRAGLATAEEKRKSLDAEIAALEKGLQ